MSFSPRTAAVLIITAVYVFTLSACSHYRSIKPATVADVPKLVIEQEKLYKIKLISGKTVVLEGKDILVRDDLIGLRFDPQESFRYYPLSQFEDIRVKERGGSATGKRASDIVFGCLQLAVTFFSIALQAGLLK